MMEAIFGTIIKNHLIRWHMNNYSNENTARRYKAHVSIWGTTQLHLRNPFIIAWWSAAFPGFGHMLLSKYLRGYALFIWEVIVNLNAHVNSSMIYTFGGHFDKAKDVLDTRWLLMYIPVYAFGIWDSYRTAVDMNRMYLLAEQESHPYNTFALGALEINYLDKRDPRIAVLWSAFIPGLGQMYIHRILTAFFVIVALVIFFYYSHAQEAVSLLFLGKLKEASSVLHPDWLLFIPSHYGFAVYDSYINTVENNKLFEKDLRHYLTVNYQNEGFTLPNGQKVK